MRPPFGELVLEGILPDTFDVQPGEEFVDLDQISFGQGSSALETNPTSSISL
jgi:hypothetical protein